MLPLASFPLSSSLHSQHFVCVLQLLGSSLSDVTYKGTKYLYIYFIVCIYNRIAISTEVLQHREDFLSREGFGDHTVYLSADGQQISCR